MGDNITVEESQELVIDSSNFNQYFFDVRINRPQPGQIMAKFTAVALFGSGPQKQDIIKILKMDKAVQAAQIMKKIHCAKEPDCYRVCREICEDLISGMSDKEVEEKDYQFVLEAMFYTKREYVPKNDPHWETLSVLHYDEETKTFKSTIHL